MILTELSALANAQSSGFVGVLDLFTGAQGGRSVAQRLTNTYTGSLIRVRRSNDNVEADIGFDANGDLDQVALLAHTGAFNGHVTKIYDQVGSNDGVQTTAGKQGRIVISGVVNLDNGKPAVEMIQASFQVWDYTESFASGGDLAIYLVCNPATINQLGFWGNLNVPRQMIWNTGTGADFKSRFYDGANKDCSTTTQLIGQQIVTALVISGDKSYLYRDSILIDSIAFGTMTVISSKTISIGSIDSSGASILHFDGNFQEEVLYKTDEILNRAGFEANRKTYYGI